MNEISQPSSHGTLLTSPSACVDELHRGGLRTFASRLTRGACSPRAIVLYLLAYLALVICGAIFWAPRAVSLVALAPAFLACVVDARILKLPNPLLAATLPGITVVIAYDVWNTGLMALAGHLAAGLVAATLSMVAHVWARFGAGDVKLAALLGLFLTTPLEGAALFILALLGAGIYASLRSLFLLFIMTFRLCAQPIQALGTRIAFGPWLFVAAVLISCLRWSAWAVPVLS